MSANEQRTWFQHAWQQPTSSARQERRQPNDVLQDKKPSEEQAEGEEEEEEAEMEEAMAAMAAALCSLHD